MCRTLLYLGESVLLDHLLFQPDSSLVKRSYMPRMLQMLNLAGFGMMVWDITSHDAELPFRLVEPDESPVTVTLKQEPRTYGKTQRR